MSHADFVHLHLHTEYSLLDGACRLDTLMDKAHELKFPALAITDHGAMYGAIDFYQAARAKGIKPIIGCEVYVAPGSRFEKKTSSGGGRDVYHHLGLLAKDEAGYKNLIKLTTAAHLEGYYYKPRIDKEILAAHKDGLIAMSGCLASEIPDWIMKDQLDKARGAVDWFKQTLGAENFFLELQNHGLPEQAKVNKHLILWAKEFGLKLVATNDVHYVEKSHSHAHDCLVCIGTQSMLSDPKRMSAGYAKEQFYVRSAEEMKARFAEVPEAVTNTLEVAEKCNLEIEFGKLHYPVFHPPEHFTREGFLRQWLAEGLHRRYGIHAKAQGTKFIVEGIDDPTRLPTYEVAQATSLPDSKTQPSQAQAGLKPAPLPFTPFDKSRPANITSRRLPHWQQDGATYFVTFRLADSLPREVYENWKRERDEARRLVEQASSLPHSEDTSKKAGWKPAPVADREHITDELREKLEMQLDRGYGECWLRNPQIAGLIENSLRHFDGDRYLLGSYVAMPNHVHVMVRPLMEHRLSDILHSWKSFTANEANKLLGRTGPFWQDESFDHLIRDEQQLERFNCYISENPTRAGLSQDQFRLGVGLGGKLPPEGGSQESGRLEACPTTEATTCLSAEAASIRSRAGSQPATDPAVAAAIKIVMDRLDVEMEVIEKTGFISYFLIVGDFIRYGRSKGISCVARGSAAGSLVTFLLEIANVDPIRYGLLFERFLNPERVNPPDIDIDFADDRRADVIEYVREKYGKDSVAQIITFGTMGAKSVVRDVGRVMGLGYGECDRLAKMIPFDLKMDLAKALKQSPELKEAYDTEEVTRELIDTAFILEDLTRNASVHAAGVVIGDQPLVNLLPLKQDEDGTIVTQYAMNPVGELGLLKMDFLGLKTLTVIRNTCEMVKQTHGIEVPVDNLPLDDAKTYDLLNKANTLGIFQLESGGMRDLCRKFQISSVEHITALVALYRPGPMDLIPEYIKRRHGEVKIEYEHPLLEPIAKETYGILIYQEQVMQAAQLLAGYTLGAADLLRRAMGKKKVEEMQQQRETFVKGCKEKNNIPPAKANQVFDLLEKFAGYGFNKSHAAAYAIVAYQTAYLKANYPVEFFCAMMSNDMADLAKLTEYIAEARSFGIEVLGPDVNESRVFFTPANVVARASRPCDSNPQPTGGTPVPLTDASLPFTAIEKSRPASICSRALPHWHQEGATYFITFRLADSLPQEVFKRWRDDREAALREAKRATGKADQHESDLLEKIAEEYGEKLERHLDQGIGACWLRNCEVATVVEKALRHFDGERYILGSYVIMPNHVHVLVRPVREHKLPDILQSWKSFSAKEANIILGRLGEFWQPESFDHIVRNEQQLERFDRYIGENPIRAGLAAGQFRSGGGLPAQTSGRTELKKNRTGGTPVPQPSQAIRFGLAAIKGVGEGAVETMLKARSETGKFTSLSDLCERVDGRTVNRRILEALIKGGACDSFGHTRATLFAQIERTLARAASIVADRQRGQSSLFGALEEKTSNAMPEAISGLPEWPQHELLAHEKELLGFYVTGHPLTPFAPILEKYSLATTATLASLPNRSLTRLGGMIAAVQHGVSKKSGKPYSMVTLEDLEGSVQILVINENHDKFLPLLELNKAIFVIGEVNAGDEKPKIFPQEIMPLEEVPGKFTKQVHLRLHTAHVKLENMSLLRDLVAAHPGKCQLLLCFKRPSGQLIYVEPHEKFFVLPSRELQQAADDLFGEETYYAKVETALPERQQRRWERKADPADGDE